MATFEITFSDNKVENDFEHLLDLFVATNDLSILERDQIDYSDVGLFTIGSPDRDSDDSPKSSHRTKRLKQSRRPCFRPNFLPSLRILKRDIRRKYPEMIMNVMNARDINLAHQFLQSLCIPSTESIEEGLPEDLQKSFHRPAYIRGFDAFIESLRFCFDEFPDGIMYLTNSQIIVKQYEAGSIIVGDFLVRATQFYETVDETEEEQASKQHISYYYPMTPRKPLVHPIEFIMKGKYTLLLDETNHVHSTKIEYQSIEQQPKQF